jgi:hypothetical protein
MAINDQTTYAWAIAGSVVAFVMNFPTENSIAALAADAGNYGAAFDTALAGACGAGANANRAALSFAAAVAAITLASRGRIAGTPPGNPHTPAGYQSTAVAAAVSIYTQFIGSFT